jgi:hypothetical protein
MVQRPEIRIRTEEAEPTGHTHRDSDHSLICFDDETIHFGLLGDGSVAPAKPGARGTVRFLKVQPLVG